MTVVQTLNGLANRIQFEESDPEANLWETCFQKNGLVTGAASPVGLGRAIAKTIAAEGGNVVVIDLDKDAAENAAKEIAAEYGVEAIGLACNVTVGDCNEVAKVVREVWRP